jgi:hypothetical protein
MGTGTGGRLLNPPSLKRFPEQCVKLHVVASPGACGKVRRMDPCVAYRIRAAELFALANDGHYAAFKLQFERLARAYLRLADQAERNSRLDLTYETPIKKSEEAKHAGQRWCF